MLPLLKLIKSRDFATWSKTRSSVQARNSTRLTQPARRMGLSHRSSSERHRAGRFGLLGPPKPCMAADQYLRRR
jgi:hypothetical protein